MTLTNKIRKALVGFGLLGIIGGFGLSFYSIYGDNKTHSHNPDGTITELAISPDRNPYFTYYWGGIFLAFSSAIFGVYHFKRISKKQKIRILSKRELTGLNEELITRITRLEENIKEYDSHLTRMDNYFRPRVKYNGCDLNEDYKYFREKVNGVDQELERVTFALSSRLLAIEERLLGRNQYPENIGRETPTSKNEMSSIESLASPAVGLESLSSSEINMRFSNLEYYTYEEIKEYRTKNPTKY